MSEDLNNIYLAKIKYSIRTVKINLFDGTFIDELARKCYYLIIISLAYGIM